MAHAEVGHDIQVLFCMRKPRGMNLHGGDDGLALGYEGADFRARHPAFAAVTAMHPAVAIAGLSTALLLKCNPRRSFRTHSNLTITTSPLGALQHSRSSVGSGGSGR